MSEGVIKFDAGYAEHLDRNLRIQPEICETVSGGIYCLYFDPNTGFLLRVVCAWNPESFNAALKLAIKHSLHCTKFIFGRRESETLQPALLVIFSRQPTISYSSNT